MSKRAIYGGSVVAANGVLNFESFGNYLLLKRLANGGMAEVFLARPATLRANGRVQVVKRILPHAANNSAFIKMFQAEIQVCMGFNHPHTVQIHDFGECNQQPYITMEYIEGKTLKELIVKFKELGDSIPLPTALSLIAQAASGLSYAHTFVNKVTGEEVRAIHRDVSPQNLIATYDGNLKVIDFGIAKAASRVQDSTRAGTIKGKYAYLSPEQISGATLDPRADVFALGIVAWELLTLRRPFYREGDNEMTILNTITNCDHHIKAPSYYNGEIPPEVDEIILKALRKNPEERWGSAKEFQSALRRIMQARFPEYTYSDNAKLMQSLFENEIIQEREEIRELNMNAQLSLSNPAANDATTVIIDQSRIQGLGLGQAQSDAQIPKVLGIEMDLRLQSIEKMMKQKASKRHYVLFAFYLISLLALKLDGDYGIFEAFLPQVAAASTARAEEPDEPKAVSSKRQPARASKANRQKGKAERTR